jgi:hypothetical protein
MYYNGAIMPFAGNEIKAGLKQDERQKDTERTETSEKNRYEKA